MKQTIDEKDFELAWIQQENEALKAHLPIVVGISNQNSSSFFSPALLLSPSSP
jgi:hypothetical protein